MSRPMWVKCEACDDYFCALHMEHVFECDCAAYEDMLEQGVDPYEDGAPDDVTLPGEKGDHA